MTTEKRVSLEEVLSDEKTVNLLGGMARRFANSYRSNGMITYDDLYNEGILGIHKALSSSSYNPDHGSDFASYAYCYILAAMTQYCNKFRVSLSGSVRELRENADEIKRLAPGGIDLAVIDVPYNPSDIEAFELRDTILHDLSPSETSIMLDRIYNELSYRQLATKYGMSSSGINRLTKSIHSRIRDRREELI